MDRRGAALLQRRLDEAADDTDAVDDGARRFWPRLRKAGTRGVGACGKAALQGFPRGGGRCFSVHGLGSVHAVFALTNEATEFPPLDGTLPLEDRAVGHDSH